MGTNSELYIVVAKEIVARRFSGESIEPEVLEQMIEDTADRLNTILVRMMFEEVDRIGRTHEADQFLDNCEEEEIEAFFATTIPDFQGFVRGALRAAIKELGG